MGGGGQGAEFVFGRAQVFLGIEDHLGSDDLSRVSSGAAHQGQQRGAGGGFSPLLIGLPARIAANISSCST